MDKAMRHLVIFCDSCGGQNKNYTVIRFINVVVHELNLLDFIKIIIPIRGHSYLECDKNMGFNQSQNQNGIAVSLVWTAQEL